MIDVADVEVESGFSYRDFFYRNNYNDHLHLLQNEKQGGKQYE